MFKFLSTIGMKSQPEHPLSNLDAVTRWMDDLPIGDSVASIESLTLQIKEYTDQEQAATKERLAVLNALDQGAQEILEVLRIRYLQNPRMSRAVESRMWNTINDFYHEILRAYHSHIMEYIGKPSDSKIADAIPLLTARALWYFGLDAKWSYYRFMQANPKLWKRMHNLFHFAEHEGFETCSLKLYAHEQNETSIAQLFLEALMLDTLNTGSLAPRQMHLIERWLPMLVRGTHFDKEYKQGHHAFYVNLEESRGARRVRRNEPGAAMRYWDTFGIKEKLDHLRSQLSAGAVPAKLGLTEDCRLPICLELLERISAFWSPTGPKSQRAFERKNSVKAIEVVRGLKDICWNVSADNLKVLKPQVAESLDGVSYEEMVDVHLYGFVTKRTQDKVGARLEQGLVERGKVEQGKDEKSADVIVHERWMMENESEGGYGAQITDQADDWVRLGKLVGLKPAQKGHWNIGVIRRMLRAQPNQQSIGIEVLAERPVALQLRAEKSERRPLSVDGIDTLDVKIPFPALFLKGSKEPARADALILQSAEFANGRELWFSIRGTTYHIRLKRVLEQGDDWLCVSFEVVSKHTPTAGK